MRRYHGAVSERLEGIRLRGTQGQSGLAVRRLELKELARHALSDLSCRIHGPTPRQIQRPTHPSGRAAKPRHLCRVNSPTDAAPCPHNPVVGTNIQGYVECRTQAPGPGMGEPAWHSAIELSMLGVIRDYDAFACLFGVRDPAGHWRPVAADRGLPADVSDAARTGHAAWGDAAFGATWLGWNEILAIDWDEPALPRATHIARYRRLPAGALDLVHREDWSRGFARASGIDTLTVDPARIAELWAEGTEWHAGTTVFRAERARRRDAVGADGPWRPVWTVMRTLAGVHGDDNVRLVAWFDE